MSSGALLATPRRHIRFTSAARRHGIKRDSIRFVITHCGLVLRIPPPVGSDAAATDRLLYLGDDAEGVPIEVMAVRLAGQELLVIHAMNLRGKHMTDYSEAKKWRL